MTTMIRGDVRQALLQRVKLADGKVEVGRLLSEVAHDTDVDIPLVTATMWDLIDERALSYGTDALVRGCDQQQ